MHDASVLLVAKLDADLPPLVQGAVDLVAQLFHVDAVEFGGGAETFVTERVSVRGEYGIVLTENLLDDLGAPASLKKTGATGSISAVLHF